MIKKLLKRKKVEGARRGSEKCICTFNYLCL